MFMSEQEARETADKQGTDHAIAKFYQNSMIDAEATEKNDGMTTYKDVLYVKITLPGIRGQEWAGKVTDEHKARFPRQLEAFLADEVLTPEGYPIKECSMYTPAEKDNLKARGFLTVESLAEASDAGLKGMGMQDMKNRAGRFMESLTGPAATANKFAALEKRLAAVEAESADKDEIITEQAAEIKKKSKGK